MNKIILLLEKCIYTFYGIIKIILKSKFQSGKIVLNSEQKDCYVLGNGPSLHKDIRESGLTFKSENLIVVNYFGCSDLYNKLKPHYYVFADSSFYVDNINQEDQLFINNFFMDLREKTTWPLLLFVPHEGQKRIQNLLKENKHITVTGYNKVNTWKGFKWFDRFVYNKQWATFSGINVAMVAIHLAIYAGFKRIYLLGVDHSWHKNIVVGDDNRLYVYDPHFYETEGLKPTPVAIKENNKIIYLKLHEWLGYLRKAFEVYHYIEDYAKYKKVKIINCTADSFIDAFERVKSQELYST